MIETVEHETCCLAFTAISDGWLTNKLITFDPITLPRQMKCKPRARCNIHRPFQTRRHRSRHQHSRQQTHFRQRSRKFIIGSDRGLSGSSISLDDFSILLCVKLDRQYFCRVQGLPGCAPQQTWCSDFQRLVERTSLSRYRPQVIRKLNAKVHGDFLLDSAPKSSGEGPLQSRQ